MREIAMQFRSIAPAMQRIITVLIVAAVALMIVPIQQADAQEYTSTSTTMPADPFGGDTGFGLEPTEEPSEDPAVRASAEAVTSAAHQDDYTEDTSEDIDTPATSAEEPSPAESTTEAPLTEAVTTIAEDPASLPGALRSMMSTFPTTNSDEYKLADPDPSLWANKPRTPNPEFIQRCDSLSVALVFDLSGSLESEGKNGLKASKNAGLRVIDKLEGAPGTNLGIFSFDTKTRQPYPVLNMASDTDVSWARGVINSFALNSIPSYQGTNWESALEQVNNSGQRYDVVYFITDGVPTTNRDHTPDSGNWWNPIPEYGAVPHNGDIAGAVDQANILKSDKGTSNGTRLEVLTVAMPSGKQPVLRDDVITASGNSYSSFGNIRGSTLDMSEPRFKWSQDEKSEWFELVNKKAMVNFSDMTFAFAGADISAIWDGGYTGADKSRQFNFKEWRYETKYQIELPTYELNQPTGRQIALSLSSDVTDIKNFSDLESTLDQRLPAPCVASVDLQKSVIDHAGNTVSNESLEGWTFDFTKDSDEFGVNIFEQHRKTNDAGKASWRMDTKSPQSKTKVTITETVQDDRSAVLSDVVCRDEDDALVDVERTGQEFSFTLKSGQAITCEVENQLGGFDVSKKAAADQNPGVDGMQALAGIDGNGSFNAYYQIEVKNLSSFPATLPNQIVDTLKFPAGYTVDGATFTVGGTALNVNPVDGEYWIPKKQFGEFDAKEVRIIDVKISGTASPEVRQALRSGASKGCVATGGSANAGLVNKVSMDGDVNDTNNTACVDVELLDVLLKLLKVDHQQVEQALNGAEFTLYKSDGGQIGEAIGVFEPGVKGNAHTARVDLGAEYFIVESKAPSGYNLLPAPIQIRVVNDETGQTNIEIVNEAEAFSATPVASDSADEVILQVADLQSGALPKSGGMGVVPFAIVALMIMGFGVMMLRRKA